MAKLASQKSVPGSRYLWIEQRVFPRIEHSYLCALDFLDKRNDLVLGMEIYPKNEEAVLGVVDLAQVKTTR